MSQHGKVLTVPLKGSGYSFIHGHKLADIHPAELWLKHIMKGGDRGGLQGPKIAT